MISTHFEVQYLSEGIKSNSWLFSLTADSECEEYITCSLLKFSKSP